MTIDLDSTICETYGLSKEGARHHGYTGQRGYHPLLAVAAGTGEVLMARLREGRANTARGAAHFLRETLGRVRYGGAKGQLTVRADSGFYTHSIVAVCRKMGVRFSITIRQHQSLRSLIEAIPEGDWTPIPYWMDGAADVAETNYTPFQSEPDAAPVRLIVRRVKPTPGSQLALFATYSYHAFITDRDGDTLDLEADHRRHAEIENAIRDLKYGVGAQPSPVRPFPRQCRLAGRPSDRPQPGTVDGAYRSGRACGNHQDTPATLLLPRRTAHPLGPTPHTALASALALGGSVHSRPGSIARIAAPFLTAASATDPPRSSSSASQSKVSPTRAARIGQRECLAAYGHFMRGSPQPTTGQLPAPSTRNPPGRSHPHPSYAPFQCPTTRFGGFGFRLVLAASCSCCNSQVSPTHTAKFNKPCPRNSLMHSSIKPTLPAVETPAPSKKGIGVGPFAKPPRRAMHSSRGPS